MTVPLVTRLEVVRRAPPPVPGGRPEGRDEDAQQQRGLPRILGRFGMRCPRCQAENREGARFCRECGATFSAVCWSCGAKVEAGSKFCDGCGASLDAPPASGPRASRFASPESYTPTHLAERILTSKSAMEGERKQVTRSEEHTSELQSLAYLVCRLLLEKKKKNYNKLHLRH